MEWQGLRFVFISFGLLLPISGRNTAERKILVAALAAGDVCENRTQGDKHQVNLQEIMAKLRSGRAASREPGQFLAGSPVACFSE